MTARYRSRAFHLLMALVVMILVVPLLERTRVGDVAVGLVFSLVLLTLVSAMAESRRVFVVMAGLAVIDLALLWTNVEDTPTPGRIAGLMIFVVLGAVATAMALRRVVLAPKVDFETLCGAVAVYLLIGVNWATTYVVIEALDPAAFHTSGHAADPGLTEFLYFSFTTLTTLGYGDIVPVGGFARIWSVLEAIVGVLFLATMVARLVSLYRS